MARSRPSSPPRPDGQDGSVRAPRRAQMTGDRATARSPAPAPAPARAEGLVVRSARSLDARRYDLPVCLRVGVSLISQPLAALQDPNPEAEAHVLGRVALARAGSGAGYPATTRRPSRTGS
ncbi:hypothetical protein B2J93_5168 [Marssonina coronariae]|uniref:Uncharacterized protein n=1 Tax=Diplocarpon coronariae TaxID=2795749 RepID=A0A218ZF36_9HELO|nr:hypothetical protein JHW43_000126 [Diplocarpon mali]OWP06689.1 hypothetical protein B2J93_5168 [Marssonina coronariae]